MRNALDLWRGAGWAPMRELTDLHRGIDRLFEDMFTPALSSGERAIFSPAVDLEETDGHFLLSFDLPGMRKEDIRIELHDNQLTVSGERRFEHQADPKSDQKTRHAVERYYGKFTRSFTLPAPVDADKVEAAYEQGVLKIAVPKSEAAKPRQIKIGESKEGGGFFSKLLEGGKKVA